MRMKTIISSFSLLLLSYTSIYAQQSDSLIPVGYGQQSMKTQSGAAFQSSEKALGQGQIYQNPQRWQAILPGVTSVRAGSDPNGRYEVRIRGLRTFNLATTPLYVIDGVPGLSLSAVDPSEISSVTVLRDGASAAIYGAQAANGVILINTDPNLGNKLSLHYSGQVAHESLAGQYQVLDESAFLKAGGFDFSPGKTLNTNWQDLVSRQTFSQAHHLGARYGNDKGGWLRADLHFRNNEGVLRSSGFKQYNGSVRFRQAAWKGRLTFSGGISLLGRDANPGFVEAWRYAIVANPSSAVGGGDARFGGYQTREAFDYYNPVAIIEQNQIAAQLQYGQANMQAQLKILPGLEALVRVAHENQQQSSAEFYSKKSQFRGYGRNGLGLRSNATSRQEILETTLQYHKTLAQELELQLLGVYSWQRSVAEGIQLEAGNIISDALGSNALGTFLDVPRGRLSVSSYKSARRLIGFSGRAGLRWRGTVFLQGGLRRDGSSTLGKDAQWGNFPFASLGADLNKWLKIKQLDLLKLRGGFGVSGQSPTDNRLASGNFLSSSGGGLGSFYYNGNYIPYYNYQFSASPTLGFERTREYNAGVDISLKKIPFWFSLDVFSYRSDRLMAVEEVRNNGSQLYSRWNNLAQLQGKGIELSLNAELLNSQNLQWNVGLVLQKVSTRVGELGLTVDSLRTGFPGAPCGCDVTYQLLYEGGAVGSFWGPVSSGTLNSFGQISFQDINKDGFVDASSFKRDQTLLGNGLPDMELGLRSNLQWRQFELNALLRGAFGHKLAHEYRHFYENLTPGLETFNKVNTRYFRSDNRSFNTFSNLVLENATFVRLQYITLAYALPLKPDAAFQSLSFEVGGQNLLTISGYTGLDPELRLSDPGATDNGARPGGNSNPTLPGIDRRNTYPLAKVFWLGVKAAF